MKWHFTGTVLKIEPGRALVSLDGKRVTCIQGITREMERFLTEMDRSQSCDETSVAKYPGLCDILRDRKLLITAEGLEGESRDDKTISYLFSRGRAGAFKSHRNLKEKVVAILGCGGVGSLVVQHLVAMGFEKFILIDGDAICKSNLNRQLFFRSADCGLAKVDVLARGITAFRPTVQLMTYKKMITREAEVFEVIPSEVELIVCAIDIPPVVCRLWTARVARHRHCASIFSGVGIDCGQVGPLLSTDEQLSEYILGLEAEIKNNRVFDVPIKGSLSATNGIIASMVALEVFNYFIGLPFSSKVRTVYFP